MRVDGRAVIRIVVFGDEGTEPLLGADTLEGLRLGVDPVGLRLIPVPGLMMAAYIVSGTVAPFSSHQLSSASATGPPTLRAMGR